MKRGEIWLVNLDPTQGAEMKKTRPALIVSRDDMGVLPLRVIVPITEWNEKYAGVPWLVRLDPDGSNGLAKPSAADVFQLRSISTQARMVRKLGLVKEAELEKVTEAIIGMVAE